MKGRGGARRGKECEREGNEHWQRNQDSDGSECNFMGE